MRWFGSSSTARTRRSGGTTTKIRAGYVVVLNGALALLGTQVLEPGWAGRVLLLTCSLSASAALVDYVFLRNKQRVTVALDELMDLAGVLAAKTEAGEVASAAEIADLPAFLRNAGEGTDRYDDRVRAMLLRWRFWRGPGLVLLMYLIAPVVLVGWWWYAD